ncbi:MAG TPA: hypothetical protein VMG60_10330 [Burkholderiaceae bacterium]|nr:hypothetical protein [Burkholderiaceae bacterium]
MPGVESHPASPTEARVRCRSRRQKLDLAVRVAFVIVAVLVLLYDKAHERLTHSKAGSSATTQGTTGAHPP